MSNWKLPEKLNICSLLICGDVRSQMIGAPASVASVLSNLYTVPVSQSPTRLPPKAWHCTQPRNRSCAPVLAFHHDQFDQIGSPTFALSVKSYAHVAWPDGKLTITNS